MRDELARLPYPQWSHWIDRRLQAPQARLVDKAWQLYQTGRIARDEMLNVVSCGELARRENPVTRAV